MHKPGFRPGWWGALAGLFGDVLELCAEAGLVEVGVVAIDGTRVNANPGRDANTKYEEIAKEILAEADEVDREEDERLGEGSSVDVLPEGFRTPAGRKGWLREASRRLEERRAQQTRAIPKARPDRLRDCKRRLEEDPARHRGSSCDRSSRGFAPSAEYVSYVRCPRQGDPRQKSARSGRRCPGSSPA